MFFSKMSCSKIKLQLKWTILISFTRQTVFLFLTPIGFLINNTLFFFMFRLTEDCDFCMKFHLLVIYHIIFPDILSQWHLPSCQTRCEKLDTMPNSEESSTQRTPSHSWTNWNRAESSLSSKKSLDGATALQSM